MSSIKKQAADIVEAAGQAGGETEVRKLAERGWPENRELGHDSPELRAAIRIEAQRVVETTDEERDKERLARAARHVDAVDLGDGRWAHYANETGSWWVVDADTLAELCDYLDDESTGGYSRWCADTESKEMPDGWDPKER